MSHRHRRYSKRELLGSLHVDYVMSVTDLGLAAGSNRWDVLRAFLAVGEARAERLVEEENGFLILQSVPGRPNTGGIYLFAENRAGVLLAALRPQRGHIERRRFPACPPGLPADGFIEEQRPIVSTEASPRGERCAFESG